jgi:hypothetical protein
MRVKGRSHDGSLPLPLMIYSPPGLGAKSMLKGFLTRELGVVAMRV